MNRDNISRRPDLRILSEYRSINSRISLALSDPSVMGGVRVGRDEGDGNNHDKESPPLIRRLISITSLVPCEGKRANIGKIN